jgi:hypothetical protein
MQHDASFTTDTTAEFNALQTVISALQPLSPEARSRIVDATRTFLKLAISAEPSVGSRASRSAVGDARPSFSADTTMSPKDFILEKQPRTDVERVACLAYYLTHFRGTPHFKTLDLSKLNTEAAQPKFANAANSTSNAVKMHYLVPSTKGQKQLSAAGERFVLALPDRDAAKNAMTSIRPRRRTKRAKSEHDTEQGPEQE